MNPRQRRIVYINQRLLQRPPLWKRWLIALGATGLLVVSFMLGAILLTVVAGIAALAALVIGLRVWWLRRKLRNDSGGSDTSAGSSGDPLQDFLAAARRQQQQQSGSSGRTIDGESEDISDRR
jgi:predicted lipid-binding transport protein (Tim44 family)